MYAKYGCENSLNVAGDNSAAHESNTCTIWIDN